jgi:hypothetical protein
MDQEQEWLKEVQLGEEAKCLLDSPLLQKLLKDLREQTTSTWHKTLMREVDARENAYHLMLAIDLLENRLKGLDDAANVAKERIATKRAKKKPVGSTTF